MCHFFLKISISEAITFYLNLGLGFLFKFTHKFTSLNCRNVTRKLWKQKKKTIILKQYLQFLYKIKFSQPFANFGSQRRALEDPIVETH